MTISVQGQQLAVDTPVVVDDKTAQTYNLEETLILMNHLATANLGYEQLVRDVLKIVDVKSMSKHQSGAQVSKRVRDALTNALTHMFDEQSAIQKRTARIVNNGRGISNLIVSLGDLVKISQEESLARAFTQHEVNQVTDKYGHTVIGDAVSSSFDPETDVMLDKEALQAKVREDHQRTLDAAREEAIAKAIKQPTHS